MLDECASLLVKNVTRAFLMVLFDAQYVALLTNSICPTLGLFSVEYTSNTVLDGLGISPRFMLGHSVGELVAATVAG